MIGRSTIAHDPGLLLKVAPPRMARGLLERERLSLGRMRDGLANLISLVAPTGFGKTSQLAQWRREAIAHGNLVFWLTLDSRDEPLRLISALAQSAHQACARRAFGEDFIDGLQRYTDPLEAMTAWLAETARLSQETLLIIDEADKAPQITRTECLSYLTGNAPANLRIAIGARPSRPIGNNGELVDTPYARLSSDHLRFRREETIAVLAETLGKDHQVELAVRLHEMVEGWPLGVQLAIAATQRNDDLSDVLGTATADIRRFFVDQVIDRQPECTRQLLIRISALDMIHPDLCMAMTGDSGTREELKRLCEETPLLSQAEGGEWMQLHPMARDVLFERFQTLPANGRTAIAARASEWLAKSGYIEAAAEQALAAGQAERAYDLADAVVRQMLTDGRIGAVLEWHRRLPDEDFERHPSFWSPAAWALAMSERHSEALPLIDRIEAQPDLDVDDRFEASLMRATIAGFSDSGDELSSAMEGWDGPPEAARAQDVPIYWVIRGLTLLQAGQPDQARLSWQRCEVAATSSMYTPMTRGFVAYGVGLSQLWEGRCGLAEQGLRPALARAEDRMGRRNLVSCMLAALLARACWESGNNDEPAALLAMRLDVLERQGLPDALLGAYLTLARVSEHQGRHDKALTLLEELRALGITRNMPRLHFSAQCEMVRQHARAGRAETAGVLARQIETAFTRQLTQYPTAFLPGLELKVALAKVHAALAQTGDDHLHEVLPGIDRAIEIALSLNRGLETVELRLLQGLVLERVGDPAAAAIREEALSLAQINGQYRLSAQYGGAGWPKPTAATPAPAAATPASSGAILTIKEREILGLLDRSLSNKEIAMALGLSEQTVKWHLKNLFQKLNGVDRKHAVARARMLGLLGT